MPETVAVILVLATENRHKAAEIASMIHAGLSVTLQTLADYPHLKLPSETGGTYRENAIRKALFVAQQTGHWAMGDDSGLEVDALNGAPGLFSARFAGEGSTDTENRKKLLEKLDGLKEEARQGRFVCTIALADPTGTLTEVVEAVCEGRISTAEQGLRGFGYDPIFFLPAYGKTFSELPRDEKNKISHRGRAVRAAIDILRRLPVGPTSPCKNCRAFTLIEILIAMAMVSILMTFVYGAFNATTESAARVEEKAEEDRIARWGFHHILRDFSMAYLPNPVHGQPRTAFEGEDRTHFVDGRDYPNDTVRFATLSSRPSRADAAESDQIEVAYLLEEGGLIRRETLSNGGVTSDAIGEGVLGINLRYLQEKTWLEEWKATGEALPKAVEVELLLRTETDEPRRFKTVVSLPRAQ
jgi:XTP/dITP diphosphohydrolase